LLLQPALQAGPLQSFTLWLTGLCRDLLVLLGVRVEAYGRVLVTPDGFRMGIANECNGLWAHLVLSAALLAYPARPPARWLGLLATNLALFGLNLLRILSLFAIGRHAPQLFRWTHVYVWQFLIIAFALALFLLWADLADRRLQPEAAGAGSRPHT